MAQVFQNAVEVRILTIHFVYQDNAGQMGFFRQLPALFGTYLYTCGSVDDNQSAVNSTESAFHFRYEIRKARRVNKVDLAVAPLYRRQRGIYRYFTFDFFRFKVRGGSPILNLAHTIDRAGAIQQSFRYGCRSSPTMTHNGNISDFIASIRFH